MMDKDQLKPILECLIFVSESPLSLKRLNEIVGEVEKKELKDALDEMCQECSGANRGIYLEEVAGGYRFQICIRWTQSD